MGDLSACLRRDGWRVPLGRGPFAEVVLAIRAVDGFAALAAAKRAGSFRNRRLARHADHRRPPRPLSVSAHAQCVSAMEAEDQRAGKLRDLVLRDGVGIERHGLPIANVSNNVLAH